MKLVRGAWKLLVGIKDGLVLVAMLLFFGLLFAALNARPTAPTIREGALLLDLNGTIVDQADEVAPLEMLSGQDGPRQFRVRDLLRAIEAARTDAKVKAIVLDLDRFGGGYPALVGEVADALARVRQGGKPVLAYATGYTDSGYRLAASASELWVHPMGGTLLSGPGGSQLYVKGLLDRLGVNAHVYRVGRYKAAVEPLTRTDQSADARESMEALYGSFLDQWRGQVTRHRPKARIDAFLRTPVETVRATGGDIARANLQQGLADRLGDRTAFGRRIAEVAGGDAAKPAGWFRRIRYDDYLLAHPAPKDGVIGVVTVAGDIIGGEAPAGTAGADTIAKFILDGLAKKELKALVVRIDSPGGSTIASEVIRSAVAEAKRQGLPVVASMGGIAASGGYWVATASDVIFAEPTTITGSIGVFGILPTFENMLAKIGVTSDGVRTTPLSGQPDLAAGTNDAVDALLQASVEANYREFLGRVAQARRLPVARVDAIAQGRVWDGGTARQLGLVDRFGGLDDAVAEAARRAGVPKDKAHARFLEKEPGWAEAFARQVAQQEDEEEAGAPVDALARMAGDRRAMAAQLLGDMRRLVTTGASVQARCLECAAFGPAAPRAADRSLLAMMLARFGW